MATFFTLLLPAVFAALATLVPIFLKSEISDTQCLGWVTLIAGVLYALTGLYFALPDTHQISGVWVVFAPLVPLFSPTAVFDLLLEHWDVALCVLVSVICATRARGIAIDDLQITNRAKKDATAWAQQQLNQKLPEIKAKYVDLENKYFAKLEAMDQQQKELSAQQASLRSLEENLIRKSMELDEREQHYNDVEAALIQKIKKVSADAERTNIQIDAFNELAEASRRIEPELRRQIEVLSASNERLKGLVGRLMPYKWVTRQMLQERDPHISAITAELLETATKNLRSRQRDVAPSRTKRPDVPHCLEIKLPHIQLEKHPK